MFEAFSVPSRSSKRRKLEDLEQGKDEYNETPRSSEGIHHDLALEFETERAENPLTRKDLELEVAGFIERNFSELAPMLQLSDFLNEFQDFDSVIRRFNLTNEQIGLLGAGFFIRKKDGNNVLYQADEYNPDGFELCYNSVDQDSLFALVWAKENLRLDTRPNNHRTKASIAQRYFLRSRGRYLATNDFGMGPAETYGDHVRVEHADVSKANSFISSIKSEIGRVRDNLQLYYRTGYAESAKAAEEAEFLKLGADTNGEFPDGTKIDWDVRREISMKAYRQAADTMYEFLARNAEDRTLLLSSVSSERVRDQLAVDAEAIAEVCGLFTNNPIKDYENLSSFPNSLEAFLKTEDDEVGGKSAWLVHADSEFYGKTVLFPSAREREVFINDVFFSVKEALGRRVSNTDPETKDLLSFYAMGSSAASYDFVRGIGAKKAEAICNSYVQKYTQTITQGLNSNKARHLGTAWNIVGKLGLDTGRATAAELEEKLAEACKFQREGLWEYLEEREQGNVLAATESLGNRARGRSWMEILGSEASQKLFSEARLMYEMACRVASEQERYDEAQSPDTFLRKHGLHLSIDWKFYDFSQTGLSDDKVTECLGSHTDLLATLIRIATDVRSRVQDPTGMITLSHLIKAVASGRDLHGVALAYDKMRYLNAVIEGDEREDIVLALSDWPQELRKAVTPKEIDLYYEHADDYILRDPDRMLQYATWRASEEGKEYDKLFTNTVESRSDLDFRFCLSNQTPEVRFWYKLASEYIGHEAFQKYFLRFCAVHDDDGRFANWHDVLYWTPNFVKLEASGVRAILNSIETADENRELTEYLLRYNRERDPLLAYGPVQSLRELKKRVVGIESNIDLSSFPPQVVDIVSAPGFNLAELEQMQKRNDFQALVEGELDKKQPFRPAVRVFAGRSLTEALNEGLGSRKLSIRGTAKDPKGLFNDLRLLVKDRVLGEKKMEVTDLLQDIPTDLEEKIILLLQEHRVDIGPTVEAQVHAKSDPKGWVCGNFTDCCMPFGDPKNTDYMFNPSTQYFTVKYGGRIVAQSVIVDSLDIAEHATERNVVILDNIEIAKNYQEFSPLIARVYQTFWSEYTSRPVKVGTGYTDLIPPGGELEENHYRAKTHLVYSDAVGPLIYSLPKARGVEALDEIVTYANLTERFAEQVARLEADIYPEGMTQGKAHISEILRRQRELEVPGPASSFIVRQGEEIAGYLLVLPEESELKPGEKVAHVYDMAIKQQFQGKGLARKMMERVLDIAEAYQVPIEAEARASTSYAMLMNERVRRWFESRGFFLTHNKKMEKYLGDEDFYMVRFEHQSERPTE